MPKTEMRHIHTHPDAADTVVSTVPPVLHSQLPLQSTEKILFPSSFHPAGKDWIPWHNTILPSCIHVKITSPDTADILLSYMYITSMHPLSTLPVSTIFSVFSVVQGSFFLRLKCDWKLPDFSGAFKQFTKSVILQV